MKAFLLFALALANLAGGAFGQYNLVNVANYTDITFWNSDNITFKVGFKIDDGAPVDTLKFDILADADCNTTTAKVKDVTSYIAVTTLTSELGDKIRFWNGTIQNASAAPSLYGSSGLPYFCARVYYAFGSSTPEIINEKFVAFNHTKVFETGMVNFTLSGTGLNTTEEGLKPTEKSENVTSSVNVTAHKAVNKSDTALPTSYGMGSAIYFCVYASEESVKVSVKEVTCSNDGSTRQLVLSNGDQTYYDPLTSFVDPTLVKYDSDGAGLLKLGNSKMTCLKSVITAGFFKGSDTSFTCSGTALTGPGRRHLEGGEGRSLQPLDEGRTSFATTFPLDRVKYDTLTASASVVIGGAGLSIASILLSMIM